MNGRARVLSLRTRIILAAGTLGVLGVLSFPDSPVAAEESLNLDQCLSLARSRCDEMAVRKEREDQSRERIRQAQGGILPEAAFKYSRLVRDSASGSVDGDESNARFTATQPLFRGFSRKETVSLSKTESRVEELETLTVWRGLKRDVTELFYAIVQIDTDISNIQNTVQILQNRIQELNERVHLGKSRESEVLTVESQMATLKAQQEAADGQKAEKMESLSRFLGREVASFRLKDDGVPGPSTEAALETYLEKLGRRSDIEAARQRVRAQRSRIRVTRGDLWPSLNLDGSWYVSRSGSLSDSRWDASLSLDLPLFRGGVVRSRVREETSRLREAENELALRVRDAAAEIRRLYQAYLSAVRQVAAYQESYAKAEKSYRLQQRDYRLGLVNNLDVVQAMVVMSDAKRYLDRALVQVKTDSAILKIESEE
ncbi:MAG TPA: TolC family protein [Elusimicrobiota bacterium]|nr:TolC family protein [Elusimicrobiota bacterium]